MIMKTKYFLLTLALCCGMNAMAQRHHDHNGPRGPQGGGHGFDMVVDTAIINHMDLEPEVIASVQELQQKKNEELKTVLIEMAGKRTPGQAPSQEEIAEMREQIESFKLDYRMALRKVLGVENYITYLEKQVDKRPQMGGRPGAGPNGRQRRGNKGNFGGGNFGGGQMGGFGEGQANFGGNEGFGNEEQ